MKSLLLTFGSLALTAGVVANAYMQNKQFYPSVVYITKSSPSMAVCFFASGKSRLISKSKYLTSSGQMSVTVAQPDTNNWQRWCPNHTTWINALSQCYIFNYLKTLNLILTCAVYFLYIINKLSNTGTGPVSLIHNHTSQWLFDGGSAEKHTEEQWVKEKTASTLHKVLS